MANKNTVAAEGPKTQAQRIIDAFGGVPKLVEALAKYGKPRDQMTIYRWTYPTESGGTGGLLPPAAMTDVLYVAKRAGVDLSDETLSPRVY
jgi:hypothetical protein